MHFALLRFSLTSV